MGVVGILRNWLGIGLVCPGGILLVSLPAGFDVEGAARRVADEPDVWNDGSLVDAGSSALG